MDLTSLAGSAVAARAQQTRDGFAIAMLQAANQREQAVASLVAQTAEAAKSATQAGIGGALDRAA